jgi:hypothetical protein
MDKEQQTSSSITRRRVIRMLAGGGAALSPVGQAALNNRLVAPTIAHAEGNHTAKQEKLILAAAEIGMPYTGWRLSQMYEDAQQRQIIDFQSVRLRMEKDESVVALPLVDEMHDRGFDRKLESGELGVIVPPKTRIKTSLQSASDETQRPEKVIKLPDSFQDYVDKLKPKLDPGLPTSAVLERGPFRFVRFQNLVLQEMKVQGEEIMPVLVGEAAKQLGLIPKGFELENPTDDQEFINSHNKTLVQGYDIDQLISLAAGEMGISDTYARSIVYCESRYSPVAYNYESGASGLWQIMPVHAPRFAARGWNYWEDRFDPYKNTIIAIEIKRAQGIGAWDCA